MDSVRFNVGELNLYIAHSLSYHLGPGALSGNYRDVIVGLMENSLYPYVSGNEGKCAKLLTDRGISYDDANDILVGAYSMVNRMLMPFFHTYIGEFLFDVTYEGNNSVVVDNLGTIQVQDYEKDDFIHERFVENTMRSINGGDWVSPKLRRLAGY